MALPAAENCRSLSLPRLKRLRKALPMPRPSSKPVNILLVMLDQMSALSLPCYGHPVVQAPHMTALAQEGVVFEGLLQFAALLALALFHDDRSDAEPDRGL